MLSHRLSAFVAIDTAMVNRGLQQRLQKLCCVALFAFGQLFRGAGEEDFAAGVWQVVLRNDKRNAATPPVVQGQSVPLDPLAQYATTEVAQLRDELAVTRARKRAYRDELLRLDQDPDEVLRRAGIID